MTNTKKVLISDQESIPLRDFLSEKGFTQIEKYTILVNGEVAKLDYIINKNDEVIVVPILKGG